VGCEANLEALLASKEGVFQLKYLLARHNLHLLTEPELRTIKMEVRDRVSQEKEEEFERRAAKPPARETVQAKWQRAVPRPIHDEWILPQHQLVVDDRVFHVHTKLTSQDISVVPARKTRVKPLVANPVELEAPKAKECAVDFFDGHKDLYVGPEGTKDAPIEL
jgi:hypothetical protein